MLLIRLLATLSYYVDVMIAWFDQLTSRVLYCLQNLLSIRFLLLLWFYIIIIVIVIIIIVSFITIIVVDSWLRFLCQAFISA